MLQITASPAGKKLPCRIQVRIGLSGQYEVAMKERDRYASIDNDFNLHRRHRRRLLPAHYIMLYTSLIQKKRAADPYE